MQKNMNEPKTYSIVFIHYISQFLFWILDLNTNTFHLADENDLIFN